MEDIRLIAKYANENRILNLAVFKYPHSHTDKYISP